MNNNNKMQFEKEQWKRSFAARSSDKADRHASEKQTPQNSKADVLSSAHPCTAGYGRPSHTVHSCSLHAALLCKYERSTAELSSFSLSSLNFRGFTDRPLAASQALWIENLSFLSWIKTKRKSPAKPSLDVWKKLIDQIHINTDKMCVFFKM